MQLAHTHETSLGHFHILGFDRRNLNGVVEDIHGIGQRVFEGFGYLVQLFLRLQHFQSSVLTLCFALEP